MEALVRRHLGPVIGKMPGITVALLEGDDEHAFVLGTMAARPRPRDDCWEIASITKVFTGTLAAEMALRDELRLEDPIGLHLPADVSGRLPPPQLQPTLEDLATHHAGLPSVPLSLLLRSRGPDPYAKLDETMVFDQLGARTRKPRRPTFGYTNLGMGLLGHILERVAGQAYPTLMRERLLDPLGLDHTGVGGCEPGPELVPGYRKGKPTPPWTFGALAAAGAMRSTVTDLIRFARSVISPASDRVGDAMRLALQPRRAAAGPDRVGLGWMTRSNGGSDVVWHNGGTYGASSFLAVDRRRSTAVIALGNTGPRLVPRLDGPCWTILDELSS